MKAEYVEYMKTALSLEPMNLSLGVKERQEIKCLICDNIFIATPQSKVQNFKKYPKPGCPRCVAGTKYSTVDQQNIEKLGKMGFILLEPYAGTRTSILVKNTSCQCGGTPWKTEPRHLLAGTSFCAPCNTQRKSNQMTTLNQN